MIVCERKTTDRICIVPVGENAPLHSPLGELVKKAGIIEGT
jgi:hypothetical protein